MMRRRFRPPLRAHVNERSWLDLTQDERGFVADWLRQHGVDPLKTRAYEVQGDQLWTEQYHGPKPHLRKHCSELSWGRPDEVCWREVIC